MKERPILFSGPMVRALLAGTKTQTRRALRYQPGDETTVHVERFHQTVVDRFGDEQPGPEIFGAWWDDGESGLRCPYGEPGDTLWVRENGWERPERTAKMMREGADTWEPYYFDADGITELEAADFKAWGFKRRPSIHMPRWASRIQLEVTAVRAEQLQKISETDAKAEGVVLDPTSPPGPLWRIALGKGDWHNTARGAYRELWDAISGKGSWDANPWVWVVEFRRIHSHANGAEPARDVRCEAAQPSAFNERNQTDVSASVTGGRSHDAD